MPQSNSLTTPLVSAIIVSFNTRDMTLKCLDALIQKSGLQNEAELEIIVVDNASADGSVQAIEARFPSVKVIASKDNDGFGRANNKAMEVARGKYFLLLNSDAFVEENAVATLVKELEDHPRAAIMAPQLRNADGTLQRSCWPFPTPGRAWLDNAGAGPVARKLGWHDWLNWAHDEAKAVDWAIGACLLVRREVWEQVGGFDDDFWMYAEETDWQKRMKDAGWEIRFTPHSRVVHLGGASGAGNVKIRASFYDSMDRYARKHHGRAGVGFVRAALLFGHGARLPVWMLKSAMRPRGELARAKARLSWFLVKRQLRALLTGKV